VRRLFAGGGAVGLTLLALPVQVHAQEAAQRPVARVEITGSNIRRAQAETASSVITVSRADIERSGKTTVAELLQTLAVDNQGSVPASFGAGFAAGASGISLRGLGAASTLVLVNGRRMAPYGLADDGQKQFSDLNVIPADAVDRIEILKDGASSIYGSDAIAGVVNVILRKEFKGATARASDGISKYWDGEQTNIAVTGGTGDLDTDRFNVFAALEYKRNEHIFYRDRSGRDWIGRIDLRRWGYSAQQNLGGIGAITTNNAAGNAINGNVRNPTTLDYYNRGNLAGLGFTRTFPGAACTNFTRQPQGDPGGGCIVDSPLLYQQVLPSQESLNLYTRGTFQLTPGIQLYSEFLYYSSSTDAGTTPSSVSTSTGFPGGPVSNAAVSLGATHPDNPYFGTAARLRYLAADVGPRTSAYDSNFLRWIGGAKGTNYGWDWDSALLYSHTNVWNNRKGFLQRDTTFALLNPGDAANVASALATSPAYAALPPGTVWRIGENAGLNSPAVYAALSPTIHSSAATKIAQVDFKATREFQVGLPAGALGVAAGAEWRHEMSELNPTTGTERGNVIGLGYSAFQGSHNVFAMYAEALAPVYKGVELTAALRWDHFTDVDNSYTPKAGIKWTPTKEFAFRATYAKGFRAPGPAENGRGGLAAFSTATDPVRCALGVTVACDPAPIALITSPNPNLSPEKSKNYNIGIIWDPLPRTSISIDFWQVKREDEINQEQVDAAIAAGHVARDPTTATTIPGDPGAITAVLAKYVNSAESKVRGIDFDGRTSYKLPNDYGTLALDGKWTHLYKWLRTEQDGSTRDFAGTHGNCDVTNCIGTPRNRVNARLTWERDVWRVSLNANYRGPIKNVAFQGDPSGCAVTFADGRDAPNDCELASFTVFDLVARWKPAPRWEVFGSIQNLFDKVAPLDPLTFGAQAYNPLDYQGAVGRFYTLGARYTF
jgi:iron complex outermembrane receptor protein